MGVINLFHIILAGLVGTTAMILVMGFIHGLGWAEADMVRAIGSLYAGKEKDSLPVGLIIHYSAGILFAFAYALLVTVAPIPVSSPKAVFTLSVLISIIHGIVISLLLVVLVAEYHPVPRFRKASTGVVISHLIGHVAYGASVGTVFVLTGVQPALSKLLF